MRRRMRWRGTFSGPGAALQLRILLFLVLLHVHWSNTNRVEEGSFSVLHEVVDLLECVLAGAEANVLGQFLVVHQKLPTSLGHVNDGRYLVPLVRCAGSHFTPSPRVEALI